MCTSVSSSAVNTSAFSVRDAGLGAILAMLAACTVGPNFVRPAPPAADRYTLEPTQPETIAADGRAQRFAREGMVTSDWWRLFNSAQLDALVRQAISNSPTLQAQEANLRQSQDNLRAGYGVFFPQLDAQFTATRERSAPSHQGLAIPATIFNLVTLSGTVSYALDIFGGERRTVEGLKAQVDYQRFTAGAAYLSLSANVVNAGIARAAYAAQIRSTEELIELEMQQLGVTEVQFRSGTAAYANVLSVRSLIATDQSALAPLKQRMNQSEHLLAILEGVAPSQVQLPEIDFANLSLPLDLPLSLPSELVHQRPDVLSAEAQVHAASAQIGVATAAMFPSISLSGTYGAGSSSFSGLSAASGRFWSIGPSASVPLFQGGRLWYGRQAAIDAYQASELSYRQTVLVAFAQVADSLDALQHDAEALRSQLEAQRTAAEALHLLQANYEAGTVAYLDVLVADVQWHQASIAALKSLAQRYQDTVALLVALGGGWWNEPHSEERDGAP